MESLRRLVRVPDLRRWDHVVVAAATVVLAWLFWRNALLASRVVDGTRYFLLDDDMMISMRYGRNLAEGHGLVWNPGERVEGYTNFLWTLIMAGVHLLPIPDALTSLFVKAISFGLLAGTIHLGCRLVRLLAPGSLVATPVFATCMVTCLDVLHWSVWGFETTLLGFLVIAFLVCVFEGERIAVGYALLSLVPLVRSDALHVFVGCALVAIGLTRDRDRTLRALAAALVPFAAHLLFRRAYYGEWLPNTYYLKVDGLDGRYVRGFAYARAFLLRYPVVLTLAAAGAGAILRADRRGIALYALVLATLSYAVTTGGDMFGNFRFFAHVMPVVFVFAAASVVRLARGWIGVLALGSVVLLVTVPLVRPLGQLVFLDANGDPYEQIHVAMLVKKNARPESRLAVIPAGIVPYFTRMRSVDVLGKSDKHVARLRPFPGSMVGHGKLDPAHSLTPPPDLVISCRPHAWVAALATDTRTTDVVLSFLAASAFQRTYLPYPIDEAFLAGRTAIYTHPGSPEAARRRWEPVEIRP